MITTTISAKNQITIPIFLLQLLQIKSGDKLFLEVADKQLLVKPAGKSIIESLVGSLKVPSELKNIPFEKVLNKTKKSAALTLANQ